MQKMKCVGLLFPSALWIPLRGFTMPFGQPEKKTKKNYWTLDLQMLPGLVHILGSDSMQHDCGNESTTA